MVSGRQIRASALAVCVVRFEEVNAKVRVVPETDRISQDPLNTLNSCSPEELMPAKFWIVTVCPTLQGAAAEVVTVAMLLLIAPVSTSSPSIRA